MENKTKHGLTPLEVNRATTVLKKYFEYEYCQEFFIHLNQPNTFDLNDLATAAEYELNNLALCRSSISKCLPDVHFIFAIDYCNYVFTRYVSGGIPLSLYFS